MANTWSSTSSCSFHEPTESCHHSYPAHPCKHEDRFPQLCSIAVLFHGGGNSRPGGKQVPLKIGEVTAKGGRCCKTTSPGCWENPQPPFSQFQQCSHRGSVPPLLSPARGLRKSFSLQTPVFISFDYVPISAIAGSYTNSIFNFFEDTSCFFP